MGYRCHRCDREHEGLPDIAFAKPDPFFDVPEDEREARVWATSDLCVIDRERFFIRGVLSLPIVDGEPGASFGFGVWVSQKKENFETYVANYESAEIGPFFGWLSTRISYYAEDTFCLKTMAHFLGGTLRPRIELEPTEHPLSVDHRQGITLAKAWEIAHHFD